MKYKPIGDIYRDETGVYRLKNKEQLKKGLPKPIFDKCIECGLVEPKEVKNGKQTTA